MAGHSKWSQIKHKKAKEDARKGKLFTKLTKEITIAAKLAGGDPAGNARLRFLLEQAKNINMPQENAIRAIKKGTGDLPGINYENYIYEGYAPEDVALVIEVLTDNKNRAIAELRTFFYRNGGRLAEFGSVAWMFEKLAVIRALNINNIEEEKIFEKLIEYEDIKDINFDENYIKIISDIKSLYNIKNDIEKLNLKVESAQIEYVAKDKIFIEEDKSEKIYEFLSLLDDLDDVQNVYTNLE